MACAYGQRARTTHACTHTFFTHTHFSHTHTIFTHARGYRACHLRLACRLAFPPAASLACHLACHPALLATLRAPYPACHPWVCQERRAHSRRAHLGQRSRNSLAAHPAKQVGRVAPCVGMGCGRASSLQCSGTTFVT